VTTRRDFCIHACQAISIATIAGTLEGCGGSPTSPSGASALQSVNGTIVNGAVVVTVDAASPLAAVGSAALVQSNLGNFLMVHAAETSFTAVTAACTHSTCTITGFESQTFVCPCHGSRFSTNGAVVSGPATRPLRSFTTQLVNNVVTISV
jgi:cytochrome b6-f complex iron-sulfur subunit